MSTLTKEQEMARLLERLEPIFDEDGEFAKVADRVKALEESFKEEFEGVDVKAALEELEKLKTAQESLQTKIRNQRNGLYLSGIEDEDQFSILKTIVAIKTGRWDKAGYEKEILDQIREKAAHAIGDDTLGGYFVPDQVIADVITAIYTRSVFIALEGSEPGSTTSISVLSGLTGGNVKIPKFESGIIAYWIGEEDEFAESNVTLGDVTMNPKKLGLLVRLTDSMRRLQGFGFETLLRTDMARAAAKKLDYTIAFGRGSDHAPLGISRSAGIKIYRAENDTVYDLNTAAGRAALAAITDWDGGEVDFDDLDNMLLALEEDDVTIDPSHKWISAPRWFKRLKQLKVSNYSGQTAEKPYLLGIPMIPDARLGEIIGPWDKSTQIPSNDLPGAQIDGPTDSVAAKYTTIFGGNLAEVVLGRWGGVEIESDDGMGKGFTSDHTYIKLRMYADLAIRQPRALIVCPDAQAIT